MTCAAGGGGRRSEDKDWVHASVTVDGREFKDVGLRLKGNLTLRSVSESTDPAGGGMGAPRVGLGGRGPGGGGPGGASRTNALVQRFTADQAFNALVRQASTELRASLYADGTAKEALDSWVEVLTEQASDLLPAATVNLEDARVAAYFTA